MADHADRLADYVDVAERIRLFIERYPDGCLRQHVAPYLLPVGERLFVVYIAAAYRTPDDPRPAIGTAWEPIPGPTAFTRDSELMNAETSAWGRAIVALGIGAKRVASKDEVRNRPAAKPSAKKSVGEPKAGPSVPLTDEAVSRAVSDEPASPTVKLASPARKKKLDILVGELRDAGAVTTEQLWLAVGREPTADADNRVHWRTLRDILNVAEADHLIERLTRYRTNLALERKKTAGDVIA